MYVKQYLPYREYTVGVVSFRGTAQPLSTHGQILVNLIFYLLLVIQKKKKKATKKCN